MKFLNKNRFPRKKVSRICLILEHIFFVNQFEKSNKMKQEKSNTDSILQTSRSTKAASRESRKPDSESRQLDGTVSSVKDTESSVKNTESSVRSTTGRVSRQESIITTGRASNRNTAPNRDSKGPFEGFHSKFYYKS